MPDCPLSACTSLRHSAAAAMIRAGAPAKTVQTVLGHASAAFTLTVYGHIFDADLDDLATRLEQQGQDGSGMSVCHLPGVSMQ